MGASSGAPRPAQCDPLRVTTMPKVFPILVEDTTDADNQMALAGFVKGSFGESLSDICAPRGIFGVSRRHVDLSFPLAFAKGIVKNRPDFRSFEPSKNAHEGTMLLPLADMLAGRLATTDVDTDTDMIGCSEIHRTYESIMMAIGFDPNKKQSWDYMQRAFPLRLLPVCKDHLLSHHFFAREFLFNRGDLEGHALGDPVSAKCYGKIIGEIDGDVAAKEDGAYDRDSDVQKGWADARRQRARKIVQAALDRWEKILGMPYKMWIADSDMIARNYLPHTTDVIIMAPCTLTTGDWLKMQSCKRVWGMFFALDNAAEYGHWVMEEKAKNIFRNNFNTALDEDGAIRMLDFIRKKEVRAYFHPTELFKGELGARTWAVAKESVKSVKESINNGDVEVPPLLGVYSCYNNAKSPNGDPQQISDPMIVFEYLNFCANIEKQCLEDTEDDANESMMPVASYSPAIIKEDVATTLENHKVAIASAISKGLSEEAANRIVRNEKVFVVKPSYEPLNNGTYVGMNLVNRMVPHYTKWLDDLLKLKPALKEPKEICSVLPILDLPLKTMHAPDKCFLCSATLAKNPYS